MTYVNSKKTNWDSENIFLATRREAYLKDTVHTRNESEFVIDVDFNIIEIEICILTFTRILRSMTFECRRFAKEASVTR